MLSVSNPAGSGATDVAPMRVQAFTPTGTPKTMKGVSLLWGALKTAMFNAVAYEQRDRPAAERDRLLRDSLLLLALDGALCAALPPKARAAYVAADQQMQNHLLFSNHYRQADYDESAPTSLSAELGRQRQALPADDTDGLRGRFDDKLALLEALGCLGPDAGVAAEDGSHDRYETDVTAWTRYYAFRKLTGLGQLEADYYEQNYPLDLKKTTEQLLNGSDLLLAFPELFFRAAPAPASDPAAPLCVQAPSRRDSGFFDAADTALVAQLPGGVQEYHHYRDELGKVNGELAALVKMVTDPTQTADFARKYGELTQKRDAHTFLLDRKRAELGFFRRNLEYGKESTASFFSKNLNNHSAVAIGVLQTMWAGAGVETSKALIDQLMGRQVNGAALAKRLAITAGIAAGTALATYLLGPLGPLVSSAALGYFFPQPDPIKEGLQRIEKSVTQGFREIKNQLAELDIKISQGFATLENSLADWSTYIVDRQRFNALVDQFKKRLREADELMNRADNIHHLVMHPKGATPKPLKEDELQILLDDLRESLEAVIKDLYNRSYSLLTGEIGPKQSKADPTIAELLLAFYQQPDTKHFRPFHVACRELLDLAERVQHLTERYFVVRGRCQELLAVVGTFYTTTEALSDKRELRAMLLHLTEVEEHERAVFFDISYGLGRKLLGPNNHTFYHTLHSYWDAPTEFNMLAGFGLLNPGGKQAKNKPYHPVHDLRSGHPGTELAPLPTEAADFAYEQWASPLAKGQLPAQAWLQSAARLDAPLRYYVAPPALGGAAPEGHAHAYRVYTSQSGGAPRPLLLHMALAADDQVLLYDRDFGRPTPARLVPLAHSLFSTSIERWLQAGKPFDITAMLSARHIDYYWDLPVTPLFLGISFARETGKPAPLECNIYAPTGGTMYHKEQFAVKNIISEQVGPVFSTEQVGLRMMPSEHVTELAGRNVDHISYGLWSTAMAVGYATATTATNSRPEAPATGQRLPFRFAVYSNETVQEMYSPGGTYRLSFERNGSYERVLCRSKWDDEKKSYKPENLSPFEQYHYTNNQYNVVCLLQDNGNLVLYVPGGHNVANVRVAATGVCSDGIYLDYLYLGEDGRLTLRDLHTGKQRRDVPFFPISFKREEMREGSHLNRLYSGWRMRQKPAGSAGERLTSANGRYSVGVEWLDRLAPAPRIITHNNYRDEYHYYGCALVLRDGDTEVRRLEQTVHLPEILKHPEWDRCSDEQIDFLDGEVKESSQKIAWLVNEADGTVRGWVGTRKRWLGVKSEYGLKPLPPFYQGNGRAVYLELTDDGVLQVRDAADEKPALRILLSASK